MAKRRLRPKKQNSYKEFLTKNRALLLKLSWTFVVLVSILFGYSKGYPLVVEGQPVQGILIGLAYGAGALIAVLFSLFLNRKLKGL